MRLILSICMIALFSLNVRAQLNDYKYVIVPKKIADFKKENQYSTSTLLKYLFTKEGFLTVYDDAISDELKTNECLGLKVHLDDLSSLFTTKVKLVLKDCREQSVLVTREGRSKEKDYKLSYKEAITEAFNTVEDLSYRYSGKADGETITLNFKNDVKSFDEGTHSEKQVTDTTQNPMVQQEATMQDQRYESKEPTASNYKKGVSKKETVVEQVATPTEQRYSDKTPVPSTIQKAPESSVLGEFDTSRVLYAQEVPGGYQLVDSSPKIVMTLFKTSMKDVYAARQGTVNGLVFKKGEKWFFDYTQGEKLVQQELNIKF